MIDDSFAAQLSPPAANGSSAADGYRWIVDRPSGPLDLMNLKNRPIISAGQAGGGQTYVIARPTVAAKRAQLARALIWLMNSRCLAASMPGATVVDAVDLKAHRDLRRGKIVLLLASAKTAARTHRIVG